MNSQDDIIDLILSGQNIDDLIEKEDDEYTPDTPPLNLEDKNKNTQKEAKLPTANKEINNDELKNIQKESLEDNKKEKEEDLKNEEKLKEKKGEEVNKKAIIEDQFKIDETFPQFKNPLDFVKYLEIDRVSKDILDEMQNFTIEKHLKENNKYEVTEINSLLQINNEIADIDINLMFTKKDLIVFYTKNGNLLLLSIKQQKFIKSIVPKNLKNTNITCIDITNDLQELICGYQDGTIAVINIQSGDTKYTNNKIHKDSSCIEIKIYKKDKEKNELYFISTGSDGQVFFNTLKMGLASIFWRLNSTPIITKNDLSIFMIKYILNFNLSEDYVILGSSKEVWLYCISPNICSLFSIKKPNYIKGNNLPDAQVGMGGLPERITYGKKNNNNNLLLIISWDNIIYFYQLKVSKQNIINNYNEIGNYINLNNILRIGFLNKSVIYCIDNTFSIKLLNSTKINDEKIELSKDNEKPIIPQKNDFAEIEKNHFISSSFSYQNKKIDNEKDLKKIYLYSIIDNDSSIFIFGDKKINKIHLMDWEIFLNSLKQKEDFINLFSIGIELYKDKFHAFSNIPEGEMLTKKIGNYLRQIISQYVIINTGEKKSRVIFLEQDIKKISECIKITIESCIEIEDVEYLINRIEPLFEGNECADLFLQKLIPFVLRDKLSNFNLSKEIILNLIDLYYKNGKEEYLSQMILHLSIKSLDTAEIKDKLEQMNLTIPLAYLYINGENQDYFVPLQKMFDYFYSKGNSLNILINEEENNSISYSNALNKKLVDLKQILNCKEYAGHRILWYIRWILTRKKFPDELNMIEKNIFDDLVPKITYWLLNEKVISEFLKFDPKYYFMIHKNIFSVKYQYDLLVNAANDPKTKISTLASLFTTVTKLNDIQPSSLIDYMDAWCKVLNEKKIYFFLYDFIIGISNINNIKKELKIESSCFILRHYKEIVNPINQLEVQLLNRKLIDFLNNKEIFSNSDYNSIINSIVDNTFDEVKLFLYKQIDDYEGVISFYLDENSNINNKNKRLFEWINEKLLELKNSHHQYNNLIKAIKKCLLEITKISMNDSFELTKKIFWDDKMEIIESLSKDQNIQLEFIELIIKSIVKRDEENKHIIDIEEDEEITNYILSKHIYLLCELGKFDKIVPVLKSNSFYPLVPCLNYCVKSNVYEARIYLYLKQDAINDAFQLATLKLNDTFNELKKNINNENNIDEQNNLILHLEKYLNDCKNICESEKNDDSAEELWFNVLEILYRFESESGQLIKKYELDKDRNFTSSELNKNIIKNIKDLMEKMCTYVSINRILEVVTDQNKNAGFKEFKDLLIKLLSNYDNLSSILVSARNLLTNLILENEYSFQVLNSKGELLNVEKCDKCQKKFIKNLNNKENILVFLCNHTFHRNCVKDTITEFGMESLCPICSSLEISENENKKNSLIRSSTIRFGNNVENNQFQVNVTFSSRRMLQKLQKFDGNYFERRKILTDSIDD